MEVLERRVPPACKQNDWLVKQAYNITSQGGEDGVVAKIFELLDAHERACSQSSAADDRVPARRWCVEFGAWDGKHLSNTWELLYNQQERWSGVLIEADAGRVAQMRDMYRNHANVTCVNSFIALDGDDQLAAILQRACPALPLDFDLISIDIDGADYHVWAELERYSPKVVVIEFNPSIPNNIVYIQARSTSIYHGSSLAALIDLGRAKGYELVSTTTFNAFFVKRELYSLFGIADNDIYKMHDVTMPTDFFQLYDGTIKLAGCKKLIWKKLPIAERDIQVLPASERGFPCLPVDHDVLVAAKTHLDLCVRERTQDAAYFLESARGAFQKYSVEDIGRVLRYALQVCFDPMEKQRAGELVWDACVVFYETELARSQYVRAIEWLQELLRIQPRCTSSARAWAFASIGECFLRARDWEQAELHLQTALALSPDAKATLKSLAKLYTKTKDLALRDEMVQRLRQLNAS